MFIYNTTFHIDDDILDDGLVFLKKVYIPQALVSGELYEARLSFIHHQHEESGSSFSLQFRTQSVEDLNNWAQTDGFILQQKMVELFGNKMTGFNTLLEEIDFYK
ncbi:hypothetical protein M2132_000214 [Dysgonomonas sp. PH5-45]|uniref:DUF4286 family protein n=1 Tax=unclassified Dysgonomonas TaxID=2630389 RepID=UPI0024742B23|nr:MULTISPECIES: DUF4286 family protein [unclassified Dysgonomonas]MDH6353894.1 hypothetical protein [Dysgonomonas sp. PH5-45]MDH6386796.1 hypothetical protein [Dysgonomonas sp. PH5-37]